MAAPIFQVTMRSGPTPGKTFPLEKEESFLGRDLTNDVSISDPEVSRRHARFIMQGENVLVEDLGSTNGTFLNGQRISSPQQLRAGDVITLGENIVMIFEKSSYDPDATVVSSQPVQMSKAEPIPAPAPAPAQPVYQKPPEPREYRPPVQQPAPKKKKKGFPTWLIILLVAIAVVACVIGVTLYFMPASWWVRDYL